MKKSILLKTLLLLIVVILCSLIYILPSSAKCPGLLPKVRVLELDAGAGLSMSNLTYVDSTEGRVDIPNPSCSGSQWTDEKAEEIASTVLKLGATYLGGPDAAAIVEQLTPIINDILTEVNILPKRQNYANCAITCASIPREANIKEIRTPLPSGDKHAWDEGIKSANIDKNYKLICKQYRNWSDVYTRRVRFHVDWEMPKKEYVLELPDKKLYYNVDVTGSLSKVRELYILPSDCEGWGNDLWITINRASRSSSTASLKYSKYETCKYDVKVVLNNGVEIEKHNANFCNSVGGRPMIIVSPWDLSAF